MEPNFILVPGSNPLAALWSAFPELRNELDESDAEPYYIYDRFADYLVSHFLHVLKVDSREFNETIAVTERIAQISSFGRNEPRSSPQA